MATIQLWHGDICDLEVDAIVNAASASLWMSTGVGGAIKHRGGDAIEFEAVRQGPVEVGSAVVTGAGQLAARYVIHAVSLGADRRTSEEAIEAATRSAMRTADSSPASRSPSLRSAPASAASRSTRRPGSWSTPVAPSWPTARA